MSLGSSEGLAEASRRMSTGSAKIGLLAPEADTRWDDYVDLHPQASLYHKTAWRDLIQSVFGHESIYLFAQGEEGMNGVLPLIRLKSRLFGDYIVSMPYFNYGGPLSSTPALSLLLMEAAAEKARALGCSHAEFRETGAREIWAERKDKVVMELSLPGDADALWTSFGPKLRAQIRKPLKEGAEFIQGGSELLPEFYSVFSRNMRDLGTPVYPIVFFEEIVTRFPEHASIVLVRYRRKAVAAGFLLGYRKRLEIPWASSLREYNSLGVNMLLYSETLRLAIEKKYDTFDFGRSSIGGGTYNFKKQWGATEKQLFWHYWLSKGGAPPQLNPANPKYRLAISLWRRLPLFVANRVGPLIVRSLP